MKKYFRTLLLALLGRNPFQMELDELREHYEQASDRVVELYELYYKSVDNFDKTKQMVADYQTLIENLRERIGEYQERLDECQRDNIRLRSCQWSASNA